MTCGSTSPGGSAETESVLIVDNTGFFKKGSAP